MTQQRCLATFQAQAWINDYAVAIDDGEVEFDITDAVLAMGREEALAIGDDSYEGDALWSEYLAAHPEADNFKGPFAVYCEEAIAAFFGVTR